MGQDGLPDSELEAEAGARFSTSCMVEVFGNRWRHVLAKGASLSPKKNREGKKSAVESLKRPRTSR